MPHGSGFTYRDALYGPVELPAPVAALVSQPIVQRLRHIRLSNIDSVDLPGFSNISRYEHALGACVLASRVGFYRALSERDRVLLLSAALLHDSAITPFGHLVEEALQFTGVAFDHERKWQGLRADAAQQTLGGIDLQLYCGQEPGLRKWAEQLWKSGYSSFLDELLDCIGGAGMLGQCIASPLDVDNLDNVVRAAYHIGLPVTRLLPVSIVAEMQRIDASGITFSTRAIEPIREWLRTRTDVYEHLMLSPRDFAGKIMMLDAIVTALGIGFLADQDWHLTDYELLSKLMACPEERVALNVKRWLVGDLWALAPLMWMEGTVPDFPRTQAFAIALSRELGRHCFAYRIKDKRHRAIRVSVGSECLELGRSSSAWLLGVGSKSQMFSRSDADQVAATASSFFGARPAVVPQRDDESRQRALFR